VTRRLLAGAAALVVTAGLLGSAQLTLARLRDAQTVTGTFGTATLAPPTNLAATGSPVVTLAWTPSTSTWGSGYEVLRSATSGSGYSQVGSVAPITVATTTDSPATGTWYYVLRSVFENWRSAASNEASVIVGPTTTAFADCAPGSNAPVAVNAGDNNGYEGNPNRACARDGTIATDSATGTSTTNSCAATTKDRHDFWGYSLGLPASVSSIDGITVRPVVGESNNGGTTWVCVQLSWDAGASWTVPQRVVLTTGLLTAYTLGGPADTWGRSWTLAELTGSLRLRVIDSSTHPNKQVRLDAIQVAVTYTP
jgi:hypothetical protein